MRKLVANIQHDIWSHWMKYMFTQCTENIDGTLTIPFDKVQRWQRQINTPFDKLTEQEQKSDYEQADKVIKALDDGGYVIDKEDANVAMLRQLDTHNIVYLELDNEQLMAYKSGGAYFIASNQNSSSVFHDGKKCVERMFEIATPDQWEVIPSTKPEGS